jgi:1-deoxypentalenic acid 11beta-hydroxylase
LNSVFKEEGYLFFRDVLDPHEVAQVKDDLVSELKRQGLVEPLAAESVWTGAGVDHLDDDRLYELDSYNRLFESRCTNAFIEKVFGEPVFWYRPRIIRVALPQSDMYMTPAHQDRPFVFSQDDFRTVWIPLMDMDVGMGLAVASGSHTHGVIKHVPQEQVSYVFRGKQQPGISLAEIQANWLTSDFQTGDVLVFHSHVIHRGLPNRSNRIRLSLDARCEPLRARRSWYAEHTTLELKQHRTEVSQLATEEGATADEFEEVLYEMIKRGWTGTRTHVRTALAKVRAEKATAARESGGHL